LTAALHSGGCDRGKDHGAESDLLVEGDIRVIFGCTLLREAKEKERARAQSFLV
jgi:hypothetical protein